MRAVMCRDYSGPDGLELVDVEPPVAGKGHVLVDVKACSVNFPDLLMVQNLYQFKPDLPFIPGSEVSGVVREVGEGVDRFSPGDRVLGSSLFVGGLAEQAALSADTTVAIPDSVGFEDAAGLLYSYGTSHHALKDRGHLKAGESLLVLGAAGAVGLAAIEIGKVMGARVIAAASTEEKLALCRKYGADETINYSTEDLKTRVREVTGGQGADVVYDPVGGAYSEPALRSTAWEGRFLVIGFAAGDIPRIPLNLALLRGCAIVGVFWGSFVMREQERHRANVAELVDWWKDGKLHPHTSSSFPLDQAGPALQEMAQRRAMGKVVVVP